MYVSAAPYLEDAVQGAGPDAAFGKNPTKMRGYKRLSGETVPTSWMLLFDKHSSYFAANTQANRDIASVIGGKPNV